MLPPTTPPSPLASDEQHKAAERDYWRQSIKVSVVAAVISAGAFLFAGGAFVATWRAMEAAQEQARTAQAALTAADRPWIKVAGLSEPRLEIREDGAVLSAGVNVENVGRSPAPRATARAKLVPGISGPDEAGEAEALCREAVDRRTPWSETMVFPDDGRRLAIDEGVLIESIAADRRAEVERDFEFSKQVLGAERALARRALRLSFPLRAVFALIGCVSYEIPNARSFGRTAFVYRVSRECGRSPSEFCAFEMGEPAVHEGEALAIREDRSVAFAR